mmetsp:Transcript_16938/g.46657  ORF Transcript_16938/g.46657 Transcript_16938/m.46657 type:complete len:222 (-) Transcript_16938:54-719(-)
MVWTATRSSAAWRVSAKAATWSSLGNRAVCGARRSCRSPCGPWGIGTRLPQRTPFTSQWGTASAWRRASHSLSAFAFRRACRSPCGSPTSARASSSARPESGSAQVLLARTASDRRRSRRLQRIRSLWQQLPLLQRLWANHRAVGACWQRRQGFPLGCCLGLAASLWRRCCSVHAASQSEIGVWGVRILAGLGAGVTGAAPRARPGTRSTAGWVTASSLCR